MMSFAARAVLIGNATLVRVSCVCVCVCVWGGGGGGGGGGAGSEVVTQYLYGGCEAKC